MANNFLLSAEDLAQLENGYKVYSQQRQKSKKGSGRLGKQGLSAWISELGGAGGAAGGAATGAALGSVVPGIGNIVGGVAGGIIGGFGGGFGGRALENQLRDNEYRLGDALKEGAVSGAFGGLGSAWQGARGLSALGKGTGGKGIGAGINALSGMSDDAAKVAGKAIVKGGKKAGSALASGTTAKGGLESFGGTLRGYQRGIKPGNNGLSTAAANAQNEAIDASSKAFSGVGKSGQYTNIEDAITGLNKTYAGSKEASKTFGDKRALDFMQRFQSNIDNNPSLAGKLTGQSKKAYENLLDDMAKLGKKKNKDFVDLVAGKINTRYRTVSSGGSAGSAESQIFEAARDAAKGLIDNGLGTRSSVNKQLSNLLGAQKSLGKTITRDTGAGAGQGLTLGRALSDVVGPALDVTGRGLQQVGRVTGGPIGSVGTGMATRGIANQFMQPSQEQSMGMAQPGGPEIYDNPDYPTGEAPMPPGFEQFAPQDQGMGGQQPQQAPYTIQDALAEAQQMLGPNESPASYLSYAKALQEANGAPTLTAAEKKAAKQAETALQGLNQLKGLYSGAGGGQNRLPGIFGNIQGTLGNNSKAESYNKIRDSLTTALARAFGETGVLTDQDREVYKQALPRLQDTPEEAAIKLQYLEDMLSGGGQAQEVDYGTQADLSSVMSQYGGY